ncbi:MAG TPA: hypothetical protein DEO59_16895 [Balneola sp.]|nr:hypothetical protein [Balneola sp.]|tara:strand:- start:352 stop:591 length:240 start_codon:yes stop_codon:yes gene_type:complete
MEKIKIEKNIPFRKRMGKLERIVSKMETGDSFLLSGTYSGTHRSLISAFVSLYGKKSYSCRSEYDKEGNKIGTRFWRLK